jgi:nitrous oxidase accessory protein
MMIKANVKRIDRVAIAVVIATSVGIAAGTARKSAIPERRSQLIENKITPLVERRPNGKKVAGGTDLQSLLDSAAAGAVFDLSPGVYSGPIVVRKPVTIQGPRSATIRSNGRGMTIDIASDDVALVGFTIDGSGDRPDLTDSAVRVRGSSNVTVEAIKVVNALFGLVAERSRNVRFVGNEIVGKASTSVGLRGDGVRLWETRDSVVERNTLVDGRDIVVWYSSDNRVLNNEVRRCRYGTHFMYSDRGTIENNRYVENVVGIFIMYSHDISIVNNVAAGNQSDGMGLGAKESGNLFVKGNSFVKDPVGIYLDGSPFRPQDSDVFEDNLFDLCDTGVVFHSSATRNVFKGNTFRDDRTHVRVEGRGDALGVTWLGNYFDDYAGYDFDRDGIGDVPYEARSLSDRLTSDRPELEFFRGAAATTLLDALGRVFPLYQPEPTLVDPRPLIAPRKF